MKIVRFTFLIALMSCEMMPWTEEKSCVTCEHDNGTAIELCGTDEELYYMRKEHEENGYECKAD